MTWRRVIMDKEQIMKERHEVLEELEALITRKFDIPDEQ